MENMNATMSACSAAINEDVFVSRVMPKVKREVAIAALKYHHFTPEDIEDMEQDICGKLWLARSTYNPALGSLEAWAGKSAYNHVLDKHDRWCHHGCLETSLSYTSVERDADDDRGGELVEGAVSAALAKISPQDREVLEKDMHGFSGDEMAMEFGCTANAVYGRVHKARKRFAVVYKKMVNDDFAQAA